MKTCKILFLSLFLIVTSALIFASGTDGSQPDEPYKLSYMIHEWPANPVDMEWPVWDVIIERKNIEIDPIVVPQSDWKSKRDLFLNSGDMPDMLPQVPFDIAIKFGQNGVLLNWSKYIDKLPDFTKIVKDWDLDEVLKNARDADGNIYTLPGFDESALQGHAWLIRADLLEKYDLEWGPPTLEELITLLKTVKEKDPDIDYPYSNFFGLGLGMKLFGPLFGITGNDGDGMIYDWENDSWYFERTSPKYKQMLTYLRRLFDEELLDPEILTINDAEWVSALTNGKYFFTSNWLGGNPSRYTKGGKENYGPSFLIREMLPPIGPAGMKLAQQGRMSTGGDVAPATIEKDSEKLAKVLDFQNWLYTEEGFTLFNYGVEGETFKVVNGKKMWMDHLLDDTGAIDQQKFGTYGYQSLYGINRVHPSYYFLDWTLRGDATKEYYAKVIEADIVPPTDPLVKLTLDEQEEATLIVGRLKGYTDEMINKFVFGKASLTSDWDAFVKECEALGSKELSALYNKIWMR